MFSVALSVPYGPTNYEAHCPVELGLSSLGKKPKAITRLPANKQDTAYFPMRSNKLFSSEGSGERKCSTLPVRGWVNFSSAA